MAALKKLFRFGTENSELGSIKAISKVYIGASTDLDITLPKTGNYILTVSNDYTVGCLYFVCSGSASSKHNAIYPLAKTSSYFELTSTAPLTLKLSAGEASGWVYLYQIALL